AGGLEPATDDIRVRGNAEGRREATGEVGRTDAERVRRGGDRDRLEEVVVEVGAEGLDRCVDDSRVRTLVCARAMRAHRMTDPLRHAVEPGLRLKCIVDTAERAIE